MGPIIRHKLMDHYRTGLGSGQARTRYQRPLLAQSSSKLFKIICWIALFFFSESIFIPDILRIKEAYAQPLPAATSTSVLPLSPSFSMPIFKGIQINPYQPFEIGFMVSSEDADEISRSEVKRLVQYFLTAMTVPEDDLWVNLSPYEKDRIIPEPLGNTQAGKDLLLQDYLLKQLTASLTYPETDLGKDFWKHLYEKVYERYQRTDIPLNTFNKVWIVPDKAIVYEIDNMAFIAESHLKVMLEEDYQSRSANRRSSRLKTDNVDQAQFEDTSALSSRIAKEIILPSIEKEVNEGKQFAPLRQIFHSMILAIWFKQRLRRNVLTQLYANKNKIEGINISDKEIKERVYQQYLKGFKEGVYDYIRVEKDGHTGKYIPRHYVSGGFDIGQPRVWMKSVNITAKSIAEKILGKIFPQKTIFARIKLNPITHHIQQSTSRELFDQRIASGSENKEYRSNPKSPQRIPSPRLSVGRFFRAAALIVLFACLPFSSHAKQQMAADSVSKPQAIEMVQPASTKTPDNKVLKLKEVIHNDDREWLEHIRQDITLDDVQNLAGQTNPMSQHAYKIDTGYFRENFSKVFETPIESGQKFDWVKQVLVVAYQHKYGLQEDGQIGIQVKTHLHTGHVVAVAGGGEPPDDGQPNFNSSPSPSAPANLGTGTPPDQDTALSQENITDNFQEPITAKDTIVTTDKNPTIANEDDGGSITSPSFKNIIKSFVFLLTLGIHFLTLYRAKEKKQLARKEIFLRDLTRYLKGRKTLFSSKNYRRLLPLFCRGIDMYSRQLNGYVEIIIKTSNRLSSDRSAQEALRLAMIRLVENNDIKKVIVFAESKDQEFLLDFSDCEVSGRDIVLRFTADPNKIPRKTTLATKIYFSTHDKPAEVPLIKDDVQELVSYWETYLANLYQGDKNLTRDELLSYLAKIQEKIKKFYQSHPAQLSAYNRDDIATYDHMRELSLKTAIFIDSHASLSEDPHVKSYRNYFLDLARASNRFHLLMGILSVMYRFRTLFLPRNDSLIDSKYGRVNLNAQIGAFRLDKWIRILSGSDHFLARIIPLGDTYLGQFAFYQNSVYRSHGVSVRGSLQEKYTKDFYEHIFTRENPRRYSLLGRDNFRRYQSIFGFLLTIVAVFAPIVSWAPITILLSAFGIAKIGIFYIWLPWYINRLIKSDFNTYENKISAVSYLTSLDSESRGQEYIQFLHDDAQYKSTKQQLIDFINKNALDHVNISRLFHKALRFFDIYAVMKPGAVRVSFKLDGFLRKGSRESQAAQTFFQDAIKQRTMRFELIRHDESREKVNNDDIQINAISSRFFINIARPEDLPIRYKKIIIYFQDLASPVEVDIDQNVFEILQAFWSHLLERSQKTNKFGDENEIGFLLELIAEFRGHALDFGDFRTSGKQWLIVKKLAFETWKGAKNSNFALPAGAGPDYFLELSSCANEARNIMGEFATADTYKGFFYPDDHAFGYKYRISIGKILRGLFASSSFYEQAKENSLKSIKIFKVHQKRLEEMEENIFIQMANAQSEDALKRVRCLNGKNGFVNEVQRQYASFEFPRKRSIIGGELFGRLERTWMMLANVALALAVLLIPTLPFIPDFPIQRIFIVFLAMNYWVIPLQAHTQLKREYLDFQKEVSFEKNDHSKNAQTHWGHALKKTIWSLNGYTFYAFFFLGLLYDAAFTFASFLFMQIESLLSQRQNGQTDIKPSEALPVKESMSSSNMDAAQDRQGGIDLRLSPSDVTIIQDAPSIIPAAAPQFRIPNFQGFEFQFLQFQPLINPAACLYNDDWSQLSFNTP